MIKKIVKGAILLIGLVLLVLAFYMGLNFIIELSMPDGWLFYEPYTIWTYIIAGVCVADLVHEIFSRKYRDSVGRKHTILSIGLLLASSYIFITSITIVSDHHIIVRGPINPVGSIYEYHDVEQVNAYFTEDSIKNNLLQKQGGTFIYEITLDGKNYAFQTPSVNMNGKYAEADTYSELEDLDNRLVELGVSKISSSDHSELNDLDILYNGIFHRILSNK